jgi:hypothetical protein
MKCPGECSWGWRKILKLRPLVREKVRFRVGNGKSISLWFDCWHPVGPLACRFGERIIYDSGLGRYAKVDSVVEGKEWKWPVAESMEWLDVKRATPVDFRPDSSRGDILYWSDDPKGQFTVRNAWESLRSRGQKVRIAEVGVLFVPVARVRAKDR